MVEALREKAGRRAHPRARGRAARARAAVIGAAIALALGALAAACNGGQRFPVCRSNAECVEREAGAAVCFNLKCVECRYDTDCQAGQVCSATHACQGISDHARSPEVDAGPIRWEESTWGECAEKCKEPSCLKKCSEKFER